MTLGRKSVRRQAVIWTDGIYIEDIIYYQTSNIRATQFLNLNVSRLVLQLFVPNPLKSGVKSRMKM